MNPLWVSYYLESTSGVSLGWAGERLWLFPAVGVGMWDLALLLWASVAAPMSGKSQAGRKHGQCMLQKKLSP